MGDATIAVLRRDQMKLPLITAVTLWLIFGFVSASGDVGRGKAAFSGGEFSLAVEEFSKAVKREPTSSYVHLMLGLALEKLGHDERAMEHLTQARNLDSSSIDALYALAHFHWRKGDYSLAAHFAREAVDASGAERDDLRYYAGLLHLLAGQNDAAEPLLLGISEPDIRTGVLLALSRLRTGRYDFAIEALAEVLNTDHLNIRGVVKRYAYWVMETSCPPRHDLYIEMENRLFEVWQRRSGSHEPWVWNASLAIKRRELDRAQGLLDLSISQSPDSCDVRYYQLLLARIKGSYQQNNKECNWNGNFQYFALDPQTLMPLTIPIREHFESLVR